MNLLRFWFVVAVLSIASLVALWAWRPASAQDADKGNEPDKGGPAAVKWEYKVVRADAKHRDIDAAKTEEALNKLGEEGWECVGTVSEVTGSEAQGTWTRGILILKRAKR